MGIPADDAARLIARARRAPAPDRAFAPRAAAERPPLKPGLAEAVAAANAKVRGAVRVQGGRAVVAVDPLDRPPSRGKGGRKAPTVQAGDLKPGDDPETIEQCRLVAVLEEAGVVYHHSPNGGRRTREGAGVLRRMGAKPGFPDLVILTQAPRTGQPVVIEMKRPDAAPAEPRRDPPWSYSVFSPEQQTWLACLRDLGWASLVAYSAEEAIGLLAGLGFELAAAQESLRLRGYPI